MKKRSLLLGLTLSLLATGSSAAPAPNYFNLSVGSGAPLPLVISPVYGASCQPNGTGRFQFYKGNTGPVQCNLPKKGRAVFEIIASCNSAFAIDTKGNCYPGDTNLICKVTTKNQITYVTISNCSLKQSKKYPHFKG